MIHTILIRTSVSLTTYNKLLSTLKNDKDKDTNKDQSECDSAIFLDYNSEGIREIKLYEHRLNKTYTQYFISMLINPRVITEAINSILVSYESHIEALPSAFNNLLYDILPEEIHLPSFERWQCTRIDYAVDIHTEQVDEYIKLFNKADSPYWFDEKNHIGSLYRKTKSVTVNFYDKSDQLSKYCRKEHESVPSIAKDLLRIEVQCKNGKTSYMKRKFEFQDKSILNYLNERLSSETILSYYDKVIGSGDYYKFADAEKIINESMYSTKMKNALIRTLKLIAQARGISKAREQFQEGVSIKNTTIYLKGSKSTFNMHLKLIRDLGINPVTIPREWELNFLQNIRDEILNNM